MALTPESGRVLGCLVEKQLATPQQYPLTLNALASACNQATNRHPVMTLSDGSVQRALDELKQHGLVRFVLPSHGRSVARFRHVLDEVHQLGTGQTALLAVLLLRGPQTAGELRARTVRMSDFASAAALHDQIEALAVRSEPLVRLLPRRPGQKEDRWQQLLAVEPGPAPGTEPGSSLAGEGSAAGGPNAGGGTGAGRSGQAGLDVEDRMESLASEVAELRARVAELRASLDTLLRSLGE